MKTTYTKRFGTALMIAALAGMAGSTVAAEPNTTDADLLRGPEVVDASGPDSGNTMSGSKGNKAKATGDLPFRAYLGAVRGLAKAAQDNPELALTDEQKKEIRAIGAAHREKMKAFMEEHKEQFAELRGKRQQAGKRGNREKHQTDGQDSKRDANKEKVCNKENGASNRGERSKKNAENRPSKEDRKKLRDLMSKAPSDQGAIAQLWTVLTLEQQEAVKANIKDMRAKRHSRVDEAMDRGRKGREGKKSGDRKGESQGMIESPIFEIDEIVEMSDDC